MCICMALYSNTTSQIYTKFRAPTCSLFPVTSISVEVTNIYNSIMGVTVVVYENL